MRWLNEIWNNNFLNQTFIFNPCLLCGGQGVGSLLALQSRFQVHSAYSKPLVTGGIFSKCQNPSTVFWGSFCSAASSLLPKILTENEWSHVLVCFMSSWPDFIFRRSFLKQRSGRTVVKHAVLPQCLTNPATITISQSKGSQLAFI